MLVFDVLFVLNLVAGLGWLDLIDACVCLFGCWFDFVLFFMVCLYVGGYLTCW